MNIDTKVDSSHIRRAIELADLNGIRLTMYHLTGDPEIKALPMAIKFTDEQREMLANKAVAWLEKNAGPRTLPEPPEDQLRELLDLATQEKMADLEFEARRDLAAFTEFPWTAQWTNGKPELPEGFKVAVIGSGFSGIATGVQMELLGIPYVILDRNAEAGGTWTVNRYPDIRVDTNSIAYDFGFEKSYKWTEHYGRGPEVRGYLNYVAKKYGVLPNIRFKHELASATFDEGRNKWTLGVATPNGTETMEANVVITAVGTFLNPKYVKFKGQESFKGRIMHPARWPRGLRLPPASVWRSSATVPRACSLWRPWPRPESNFMYFSARLNGSARAKTTEKSVEPEIRWLVDNFPGYWNWARYMASAYLFETHDFFYPDEDGKEMNKLQGKPAANSSRLHEERAR